MVNYAPLSFPGGVMLTVVRHGTSNERDWRGDYATVPESMHTIGPVDLKWLTDSEDNSKGEVLQRLAQITAPLDSDVQDDDTIRIPGIDGDFSIDGGVRVAPNGFTGWAAGKRFKIAKDGPRGV